MTKAWQIYYNAIFGAIGGLLAWLLVGLVETGPWNVHLANIFVGAGIGLFIGGALGAVEGMIIKRSFLRTITGMVGGGLAGVVSGVLGLFLGGIAFLVVGGGLIARMLGWMTLGLFLGLGQGVVSLKLKRAGYGLIGGTLAGLVGGALYEVFTQAFIEQSAQVQVFLSAIGLILIGMSLGFIIPLSVSVMSNVMKERGLVIIQTGRRANTEVEIIGSATLGSSDGSDVFMPDKSVEKKQAVIRKGPKGFLIENVGMSRSFMVNQSMVPPKAIEALGDGAQIQMGETRLHFRTR